MGLWRTFECQSVAMVSLFWILVLTSAAAWGYEVEEWNNQTTWIDPDWQNLTQVQRDERFFSFFNVIRFKNVQCTGTNGLCGTCYSRKECASLSGLASGSCARNWGTCCVIQRTCGSTSNLNCTYFSNPGYPGLYTGSGRCSISITKCNSNICQLRIDLLDFTVGQPDANGNCLDDYLEITGGASSVPRICGENTGQHVYVDFPADNNPIQITVRTNPAVTANRKWNIRINQIECTSPERAPTGCLMYYTGTDGRVNSFNYAAAGRAVGTVWTRELANLNYGVCIRMAPGYCSIEWRQAANDPYSFTVSGDTGGIDPDVLGTDVVAESGAQCTTDFVVIPNPYVGSDPLNTDRFCGNGFVTKTTASKPFVLTVVTNEGDLVGGVAQGNENRGFSLNYRQIPCQ
ncbi:uncharacterized protein [Periplaneta americana]|uniref:uncharacterized protein n=1 Tax=Periplaneta americana TaxID=6978 RepID=UPI0037E947DA